MIKKYICFILIFISCGCNASYFCGHNKLVNDGDTTGIVRSVCGSPMSENYIGTSQVNGSHVNTEKWTYNPGVGRFYQIFVFHNNILVAVESGSRIDKSSPSHSLQGCCSWHKGVCGCRAGKVACCDGTLSPTCGC